VHHPRQSNKESGEEEWQPLAHAKPRTYLDATETFMEAQLTIGREFGRFVCAEKIGRIR
jgi:hypothetical protein